MCSRSAGVGTLTARIGVVLALMATLLAPGVAEAVHTDHTLEVSPEIKRVPGGSTQKLKATITPEAEADGVQVDFEITKGPNDGDDDDLTQPDLSCTVPEGDTVCRVSYRGRKANGTDTIVAWIDHDGDNATVEADEDETHDAGAPPEEPGCPEEDCGPADPSGEGDEAEPDSTDVVLKDWGQLGAGHQAHLDGPVDFVTKGCDSGKDRDDKGRVVATAKACTLVYLVPPEQDDSDDFDFGTVWMQSTVDARKGWCTKNVRTKLRVPIGTTLTEVTPVLNTVLKKRKVIQTQLTLGSTEHMETAGYMSQSFFAYPGTLQLTTRDSGQVHRLVWKGSDRRRLSFALGFSLSWPQADELPDFSSSTGVLRRETVKQKSC